MAQVGIHSLIGLAVRKWTPERTWFMLGIVLGSMLPDADNLAVAVATLSGVSTKGLHRTFSHSLLTTIGVVVVFYLVSLIVKRPRWFNLGIGFGVGMVLHILLDLFIWFGGLTILWPLPSWINLWSGVIPPAWWMTLEHPVELLFFALFFLSLDSLARKQGSDLDYVGKLRFWMGLEAFLFVVFLVLSFTLTKGFASVFGVVYLLSLGLAIGVTVRMRRTIENSFKVAVT